MYSFTYVRTYVRMYQLLQTLHSSAVRRGDVLAAWSGIRPLVLDPSKGTDTQSIARNHIIDVSDSNLVTIAGGKWTTYRAMAEDTIDRVVEVGGFSHAKGCKTIGYKLVGGECYYPTFFIHLIQDYGLDEEVRTYVSIHVCMFIYMCQILMCVHTYIRMCVV